ncbi:XrtA system polysaccharide deacetylase [Rhodoferax sp.]|uniref:XrtA system polysaccharide deacetylase n=1 Tax=Rhodoferax sp. TaxID=50421 RepID=UPI0025D0090E|nr:XrtA system polysaccharide deacetylase [Rhodoferax sp.]
MNIINAFTIDVEDYFQVSAFSPYIERGDWDSRECRIEANIDKILQMLDISGTKATFFTLGWIAERYPQMVKKIVQEGHELASHGYGHERASDLSKKDFFSDVQSAKNLLEDISGIQIKGYRAPSFSINQGNLWAYDSLLAAGYKYSSSIYPIKHDHYGMPDTPRFSYSVRDGLIEIPITTIRLYGKNFPSSGGGYFRLLPYFLTKLMISKVLSSDQQAAMFYFHPWEIDIDQPRISGVNMKTKFRHYVNISRMERKLGKLLEDFSWDRVDRVFSI